MMHLICIYILQQNTIQFNFDLTDKLFKSLLFQKLVSHTSKVYITFQSSPKNFLVCQCPCCLPTLLVVSGRFFVCASSSEKSCSDVSSSSMFPVNLTVFPTPHHYPHHHPSHSLSHSKHFLLSVLFLFSCSYKL